MSDTNTPVVFVIDDEVNVVNAIKRTLRSENYHVEVCTDSTEAVAMAKQIQPLVVMCDMRMPGLDGSEVFAALRTELPLAAKILLTGYADIKSTIAAINQGEIDRYLTKPWNDDELREVIRQQLDLAALRRERETLTQCLAVKVDELEILNRELDQRVEARTQEIYQTNLFLEHSYQQLHTQFLNSVKVFSNLIEMSSPLMAGHGRRVAEIARFIGLEMKLLDSEIQNLYIAGLLHDIGKIGLPEKVLNTPYTQLDAANKLVIAKHCEKGQLALMALPELHQVATYIANHHERMDGRGYPHGIAGPEIPIGARILAVAEDWDELQMGLLASQKLGMDQAIEFIKQGAGKRYDSEVVKALPAALHQIQYMPKSTEKMVDSEKILPGQILSRDLVSPEGMLLMAKGGSVTTRLVEYLATLYQKEKISLKIYCETPKTAQSK